jgi:2-oxo-4-hydroxy-4-carboxy-5-ureidoimidazoline decarboxylase
MTAFDTLSDDDAEALLLEVCAAPRWAREVVAGRPYGTVEKVQAAAWAALSATDLDAALTGHPRIGDAARSAGGARLSRTAEGSARREQAGVASASAEVLEALAAGNRAYEERFGRVYLVCASGRSAEDLLATLRARLGNDPETERTVALGELAAINRLRLERVLR